MSKYRIELSNKKITFAIFTIWLINSALFIFLFPFIFLSGYDYWFAIMMVHILVNLLTFCLSFYFFEFLNRNEFDSIGEDYLLTDYWKRPIRTRIKYLFLPYSSLINSMYLLVSKIFGTSNWGVVLSPTVLIFLVKICFSLAYAPMGYVLKIIAFRAWEKDKKYNPNNKPGHKYSEIDLEEIL